MQLSFVNKYSFARSYEPQRKPVKLVNPPMSYKRVALLQQIDGRVRQVQEDFYRGGPEEEPPEDDKDEKHKDDFKLYTGMSMILLAFVSLVVKIYY